MFAGLALLIWLPAIRCPSAVAVVAGIVAEASLYVYLTHYQVYPLFGAHTAARRHRVGGGGCAAHTVGDVGAQAIRS